MPFLLRRLYRFMTQHVDGILLCGIVLLMFTGLLVLLSASNGNFVRTSGQLGNMLVALGVMWIFANIPPHYLQRLALPVFVLGCTLLIGVALFGEIGNGARRWLHIGVTRIQPSELMKIALPSAAGFLLLLVVLLTVLVYIRHWANLQRIKAGTEPKIGAKKA